MKKILFLVPALFFIVQLYSKVSTAISNQNPSEWQFACQREALAPAHWIDTDTKFDDLPTLLLAGNGNEIANGQFYTFQDVEAGSWYRFRAHYQSERVEDPYRCILARILWQDASGELVGRPEYPATRHNQNEDDWDLIEELYMVPEEAVRARLELIYRWDADGSVRFGGVSFLQSDPPAPRTARLATVHHRPRNSSGAEENLNAYAGFIAQAAAQQADIVCLPEGVTLVGTGQNYISASEPVPGPTTRFLGEVARQHNLYIVAGLLEKDGPAVYNTSVLIDRNGKLAGKYRKISLPREEIEGGVTPGNEIHVFDTDFGRIGMMICWDVTFPETARKLAERGAEVIFLPIWGGNLTLAKARAIENQVYLVSSTYDMISAVFDREGEVRAEATDEQPVVVTEVDLNERTYWPWLGDLRNRIPREKPSRKALLEWDR